MQGWYPAPLYSLTDPFTLQTRVPGNVRCKWDHCDLGTKYRFLPNGHWDVAELHPRWSQRWTHLLLWDKCSYFWKSHTGTLEVMPSSPAHFKTNRRDFGHKEFSNCATNYQVFKIFLLTKNSVSIFYLTSSYSNLVHQGTAHHLILNFTKTPMAKQIQSINCNTSYICLALKCPPTHQKTSISHSLDAF